jgi:subtilisin family serine protease
MPNGKYGTMTGTSQATAFVTGVAALLMAHNSDYTAQKVAKYIMNTGDVAKTLKGKTRYKKVLNSYRALSILDQGISATGVVAGNIQNLSSDTFSSEKFNYESKKSKNSVSRFAASLADKIKNKKKGKSRQLNNSKQKAKP